MNSNLQVINPISYQGWDDMVLDRPEGSIFHSSHWARVLNKSYGYKPLYFTNVEDSKIVYCIPMMEINSILTGKRGVSLPFTDYCNPLLSKDIQIQDIHSALIEYGRGAGWKFIEMRDDSYVHNNESTSAKYYLHTLSLFSDEVQIYRNLRDSTRRNIKKALREGVIVKRDNSFRSLQEFIRMNCITRKLHGLPPQPYKFFKNIYNHIIEKNHGNIITASYDEKLIAGAIYFHYGDKALYKYGASDRQYQHLRANNVVMWEAIRMYCAAGYKSFGFGRTELENNGLRQFKQGWGTKETMISYMKYNVKNDNYVRGGIKESGFYNKIFHHMPIPLLKATGSLLYKHIG